MPAALDAVTNPEQGQLRTRDPQIEHVHSAKPAFFTRLKSGTYVRPDSVVSKAKSVLDRVNSAIVSKTARPARNMPASGSQGEKARANRSGLTKLRQLA